MARSITIERFHELLAKNLASGGVISDNEDLLIDTIETARKNIITEISNSGGKIVGNITGAVGGAIVGGGTGAKIGKELGDVVGKKLGELSGKIWGTIFNTITGNHDSGLPRTDFYIDAPGFVGNGLNVSANGMMEILKDTHFFIKGTRVIKNDNDIDNYVHFIRSNQVRYIERNKRGYLTMGPFEDLLVNMPLYNTDEDYQHYKESKGLGELVRYTNGAVDLTYSDYLNYMIGKYGLATKRTKPFINNYAELAGSSIIDDMINSLSNTGTLSAPKKNILKGNQGALLALGALGLFLLKK